MSDDDLARIKRSIEHSLDILDEFIERCLPPNVELHRQKGGDSDYTDAQSTDDANGQALLNKRACSLIPAFQITSPADR